MENKGNEDWLSVPGFSAYEVSPNGKVRSLKRGKCVLKKLKTKSLLGTYRSDGGVRFYSSWVRMYYCAVHGVNPLDLKGKDVFISMEDGEFKVEGKEERASTLNGMRAYRSRQLSMEEIKERYGASKKLADAIVGYYDTGDDRRLTKMIYGIKPEVLWYMYSSLRVCSPETREEVFSQSIEIFFKALHERKRIIYGLRPFFYKSARYIVFNIRKEYRRKSSRQVECMEDRDYYGSL